MRVLDKSEFTAFKQVHLGKIGQGAIFIHPTDTIYGIGCDATNGEAIEKIRKLKDRPNQPLSVIAPSIDWIRENCHVDDKAEEWLAKLPGPYTFVLKLKNKEAVHPAYNKRDQTIGVRIPNHWMADVVAELGKPIITTSPNLRGGEIMRYPHELDVSFHSEVHFCMYDGALSNPPSTVINLSQEEPVFHRGKEIPQEAELK